MKNSLRFLGKELREILRTYKIYTIPGIFLLFGFASPILTKLLPDLMENLAGEINIILPEMTWRDSYTQLFKNLTQIGILTVILTAMGTVAEERNRGVAHLILTKPVSRTGYILAKYIAHLLLVGVSAIAAFMATWVYTRILFTGTRFTPGLTATGLYILYAAVILAITVLASSLTRSAIAAGSLATAGLFVLGLLPLFSSGLSKYSPGALTGYINEVVAGTVPAELWGAAATAVLSAAALLALAALSFRRQEL